MSRVGHSEKAQPFKEQEAICKKRFWFVKALVCKLTSRKTVHAQQGLGTVKALRPKVVALVVVLWIVVPGRH